MGQGLRVARSFSVSNATTASSRTSPLPLAGGGGAAAAAASSGPGARCSRNINDRRRSQQRMWRLLPRLSAPLLSSSGIRNSYSAAASSVRCFSSPMDPAKRAAMDAAATALSSVRFFPFFYLLVGGEARKQKLNLHPAQPPSSLVTPPTSTANTDPQPPLQRRRCSSSSKKRGRRRRGEKRGLPPTNPADRRRPLSALGAAPDDRADARGQAPVHGTSQRRAPGEDAVEDGEERRAAARAQGGQSGAAEKQGRRDRDCDCCCCRCRRAREAKRRNNDGGGAHRRDRTLPPELLLFFLFFPSSS